MCARVGGSSPSTSGRRVEVPLSKIVDPNTPRGLPTAPQGWTTSRQHEPVPLQRRKLHLILSKIKNKKHLE